MTVNGFVAYYAMNWILILALGSPLLTGLIIWISNRQVKDAILRVSTQINGRMTELIEAAHQRGDAEGRAAQKELDEH